MIQCDMRNERGTIDWQATEERADHADDDVADDAVAAADDGRSEPARDEADGDPEQNGL